VQGGLTFKFDKKFTDLQCFIFQFEGLGAFIGETKPNNSPHGDRTASMSNMFFQQLTHNY